MNNEDVGDQELEARIQCSLMNTKELFKHHPEQRYILEDFNSTKTVIATKLHDDYPNAHLIVGESDMKQDTSATGKLVQQQIDTKKKEISKKRKSSTALALLDMEHREARHSTDLVALPEDDFSMKSLQLHEKRRRKEEAMKPMWHPPWKLMRVISGHNGWVRSLAVDTSNEWFAAGSSDRTIKIYDLASGKLKLTLTGHVSTVRGIAISDRHPYLFTCGEDKSVRCWDLEQNKCVRQYHGHLSGVYSIAIHPTLDLLVTGGRDSSARVWDMRTKAQVHLLTGHNDTVASVVSQAAEPQIITSSMDSTIRLWDLKTGKTRVTLTNHKKGVRSLALHPSEYTFASASTDSIKKWLCPDGKFIQNFSGHTGVINTLAINNDNVMFSGGDNGSMHFWDWKSGYNFATTKTLPQSGSLEAESAIYCSVFDQSGSRLLTGEGDKTIKVWKEDEKATELTHPIQFTPDPTPKHY